MSTHLRDKLYTGYRENVAAWIVARLESNAQRAIALRGQFCCAIPGGSVAEAVIPRLCSARITWAKTHLFWCDERDVAVDDVNSNGGQAARLWANSAIATEANIHVMTDGRIDAATAAVGYDALLRHHLGDDLVLDVVLLGVGEDGHVASLFPGHAALDVISPAAIAIDDSPKPPPRRLTLTLPVLLHARETIVAPFGAGKARVMERVLVYGDAHLPVTRVLRESRLVVVAMDDDAAADLPLNTLSRIA